jgi:hypothetical protein
MAFLKNAIGDKVASEPSLSNGNYRKDDLVAVLNLATRPSLFEMELGAPAQPLHASTALEQQDQTTFRCETMRETKDFAA